MKSKIHFRIRCFVSFASLSLSLTHTHTQRTHTHTRIHSNWLKHMHSLSLSLYACKLKPILSDWHTWVSFFWSSPPIWKKKEKNETKDSEKEKESNGGKTQKKKNLKWDSCFNLLTRNLSFWKSHWYLKTRIAWCYWCLKPKSKF